MSDQNVDFRQFHNRLRMLLNIDAFEFFEATGTDGDSDHSALWEAFQANPWRWFIRASDDEARGLFRIMVDREDARRNAI